MDFKIAVVLVVFIILAWLLMSRENFIYGRMSKAGPIKIMFFRSGTCPACVKIGEFWPKLVKKFQSGEGSQIKFTTVDCGENPQMCQAYGVMAFPTILVEKNGKLSNYSGRWQYEDMVIRLNEIIGNPAGFPFDSVSGKNKDRWGTPPSQTH